ncbi:MAG: hypothetical protein ACPGSD_17705 [Flavobacteriales bacterium]|jgi:Mg2+ and Co2+ transporter CorA
MRKTIDFIIFLYEEEKEGLKESLKVIGFVIYVFLIPMGIYGYLMNVKQLPENDAGAFGCITAFIAISSIAFYRWIKSKRQAFKKVKTRI